MPVLRIILMGDSPDFDALLAEKIQLDTLIERGTIFTVPKRSLLRYFGKPERSFTIKEPYLGTLDRLSDEYINMGFSEEALKADWFEESKRLISQNAKRCARVVAIATLNSRWGMLLVPILAQYLLWHIKPKKLKELTQVIIRISNLFDFTTSIRSLSVVDRTTQPALVEKAPERPEGSGVHLDQEEPSWPITDGVGII